MAFLFSLGASGELYPGYYPVGSVFESNLRVCWWSLMRGGRPDHPSGNLAPAPTCRTDAAVLRVSARWRSLTQDARRRYKPRLREVGTVHTLKPGQGPDPRPGVQTFAPSRPRQSSSLPVAVARHRAMLRQINTYSRWRLASPRSAATTRCSLSRTREADIRIAAWTQHEPA